METAEDDVLSTCKNLSRLVIMVGVGSKALVQRMVHDPIIREKEVLALALPGEDADVGPLPPGFAVRVIADWADLQTWMYERMALHEVIVRLAGCDILDTHPLCPEAEAFRAKHKARFTQIVADRAWMLGNDINDSFMGLHHAALNAGILRTPSIGQLAASAGQTPIIAIGAGPSVRKHLDHLRALQNKCILVACDSVTNALIEHDIIPHFVTPLERLQQQAQFVQKVRGTRAIFAGIAACHPDAVAPFEGRTIYLHARDRLYDWLAPNEKLRCCTGSSTGVLTVLIACSLTRGKVYLVGHDLARSAEGTHWSACTRAGSAWAEEKAKIDGTGVNGYEDRLIPGNDGGLVESIAWWESFRSEIATHAGCVPGRVVNVNAYDKTYALIENTLAEPLPDAATLPDLAPIVLNNTNDARYDAWRTRALLLPQDANGLRVSMRSLRDDIATSLRKHPPHEWPIESLINRMSCNAGVSPGNTAAFEYFLRSAIFNEQSYACYHARGYSSKTQALYHTMKSIDRLADMLTSAIDHLQPVLEDIAAKLC